MTISRSELKLICPLANDGVLESLVNPLNRYMDVYHINNYPRVRHFIAQAAHETHGLTKFHELYNGTPEVYFKKYDNRKDLGNTQPGDGMKFKGRGIFQLTGRYNYSHLSLILFNDYRLLDNPDLLEQPDLVVRSACWYWEDRKLNSLADQNMIKSITLKINGGYNGLGDRIDYYNKCIKYII
jgi:putative chitinase